MKLNEILEGLADYELEREEVDARAAMIYWSVKVVTPCCHECGYLSYAREQLQYALRRARAAGVFEAQPGEAAWLTRHRIERPLDV